MAKLTLNGVDALTESGGTVTIPGSANLNLGTDSVPTAAIQDDAVTSAKLDTNIAVAGTLGVTGATTLSSTLGVTGATTLSSTLAVSGTSTLTGNVTAGGNLTVTGDLIVNGTNTTVNSTTMQVDDKNIDLAHSPSGSEGNDAAVDGGGITLKSSDSDKEIKWVDADDAWTFNQHIFPETDNSRDLGSASKRFRNIYTGDLHLANDRGNWTVIEEENYLTLRNNKSNKIYKLVMEEIE